MVEGRDPVAPVPGVAWTLRGAVSFERYARRAEHDELARRQAGLGRPEATRAALIPISKSADWWKLSQDERRSIFEERSHHIATGMKFLPAIARRLHHGRDLGEPFDFVTWFGYAPAATPGWSLPAGRDPLDELDDDAVGVGDLEQAFAPGLLAQRHGDVDALVA
jgi:hypothetical protein